MNWKMHMLIGLVFAMVIGIFLWISKIPIASPILAILIAFISPLVPDIDHEGGKLKQWMIGLGLIVMGIAIAIMEYNKYFYKSLLWEGVLTEGVLLESILLVGFAMAFLGHFIAEFSRHRGIWHSHFACAIYSLAILLITHDIYLTIFGGVGFFSHMVADGIPFKLF